MKKVTLMVLVGLFCAQNAVLATGGRDPDRPFRSTRVVPLPAVKKANCLTAYGRTVRKLSRLVNNINSPSDLHKIRKTAKLALSLQPQKLKDIHKNLDLYARFGTGSSRGSFLDMSRITLDLIRNDAPERKIHSAIFAALIMAPPDIAESDFKVLRPALWKH